MWQIPSAFSNEEGQGSLETAIQTAMRENPAFNVIREKLNVARDRVEGIALLDNPKLRNRKLCAYHVNFFGALTV